MSTPVIQTHQLCKSFGSFQAVHNLNLTVKAGHIYGFLGPNGAGKSTTIRMLLGLIRPTAGHIEIFGTSLQSNRIPILRQIGSMVEAPSYYGHLTANENLQVSCKLLGLPQTEIDRVLEIVRLISSRHKLVKAFSLGMKQRLGIAQALLGSPKLLILDEPTNGLDPAGIHEIRALIQRLPQESDITILLSSHLLSEMELMASDLGIIHQGRLIFQGSIQSLRDKGKSELRLKAYPSEKATRLLEEIGLRTWLRNDQIILQNQQIDPASINQFLIHHHIEVSHLSQYHDSLEDIFLTLTGKEPQP
ncbi:ABC transporter ATP-binding protein [Marinicrinis sediminis]|uniref:ABC transporter ATP-binding protein n=1 Tax=Marinicrinis sediminis TaxID=1652465 RepID=A0ABW5R923_9BACL